MYKRTTNLSEQSPLEQYVEKLNFFLNYSKRELLEEPYTEEQVRYIHGYIQTDLSPENLHCDGEISAEEANEKYNFLQDVLEELEMHDDWGVTYYG